jgi:Zn-dependent protease with chaperone function
MDQHEYEGLVRRLEAEAENKPQAFRGRILLLSSLAYVLLFAALGLLAFVVYAAFGLVHGKSRIGDMVVLFFLATTVLPLFYAVLRMFFLRLPPPDGHEITAADAPQLFAVLEDIRRRLSGPPLHRVVVDRSFNAAIAQIPRFGLFGGHRNHLILGLPYLTGSTPQEMLATVAHEYGHLAGDHGKLGAWVYRQRRTFGALQEVLHEKADKGGINALFAAAIGGFAPYFNAYTFALSRQNEYEADATATRLFGAEANGSGLIRGDLQGRWLHEEFWPKLYAQASERPTPLFKPYSALKTAFSASYAQWATGDKLRKSFAVDSGVADTHPCLRDRLQAMQQPAKLPPPVTQTAAEALLGPLAQKLAREFDAAWWAEQKAAWEDHHRRLQRARARIAELAAVPLESLAVTDLQELAVLRADHEAPAAAKPALEHLLRQPGGPYPKASFLYARILLHENNPQGLTHLKDAARGSASMAEECARLGFAFLEQNQGAEAAQEWWDEMVVEFADQG